MFHILKLSPTDNGQYPITAESVGIYSTYNGFEIEIRRLSDLKNYYTDSVIQFKRNRRLMDSFINPDKKLVAHLKKLCEREIKQTLFENGGNYPVSYPDPSSAMFRSLYLGASRPNSTKEEVWYQSGTLNPKWNKPSTLPPFVNIVSPLFIITQKVATRS